MSKTPSENGLLHPELSYAIVGVLFTVSNNLACGHKEKFYEKAIATELKKANLKFQEQLPVKILYKGEPLGIYYFDYLIENKIILEIKARGNFSKKDIDQLYSYLKAKNLKLGILAYFGKLGVRFKRIVNVK